MSKLYVVCELGMETGRVVTGVFHKGTLQVSETRRFHNMPIAAEDSRHWNIPEIYNEVLQGLRSVGDFEEEVAGISCVSWPGAYLLLDRDGALVMPTFHHADPRAEQGIKKVQSSAEFDRIFDETGTHAFERSMLFQLAAEIPKRLKHASYVLPIADGLNFLLSGKAQVELSMASATQLYNSSAGRWSAPLLRLAGVPEKLLPEVVSSGTVLGPLLQEISKATGLEGPNVVAGCSEQMAAALAGLPVSEGEEWAFLYPGSATLVGTQVDQPVLSTEAQDLSFNSQPGPGGIVNLYKRTNGLSILDACVDYWDERNKGMDIELLSHLAGSAAPFESLIDPADPRFFTSNDMPLKIQAFCKETNQPVPRKPGPVYRCILESLALMYRRLVQEAEYVSGKQFGRVFIMGGKKQSLLNHFIANALQRPIVVSSADSAAIGSIIVQALAVGEIPSATDARQILRQSCKLDIIMPHASVWESAYERFVSLNVVENSAS